METTYKTIIVTFKESIDRLNGIFDAPQTWGASTLKEWVDAYESSRLVQIGKNTAISGYTVPEDYSDGVLAGGETLIKAGERS